MAVVVVLLVVLVALIVKAEHVVAMLKGTVNFGYIPPDIELPLLLGAIAFAGAGGSMNLAQSDFVRDKGYGMGRFIGRITSPLTGEEEVVADIGYHFEQTEENMGRWKAWWRAANLEHIVSFYVLAVLSLILLSLISYSTSAAPPSWAQASISFAPKVSTSASISASASSTSSTGWGSPFS